MVRTLSLEAASRVSRRSLLGRAGRLSLAAAGISTIGTAFGVEEAKASYCGYDHSVECARLNNWGRNSTFDRLSRSLHLLASG